MIDEKFDEISSKNVGFARHMCLKIDFSHNLCKINFFDDKKSYDAIKISVAKCYLYLAIILKTLLWPPGDPRAKMAEGLAQS